MKMLGKKKENVKRELKSERKTQPDNLELTMGTTTARSTPKQSSGESSGGHREGGLSRGRFGAESGEPFESCESLGAPAEIAGLGRGIWRPACRQSELVAEWQREMEGPCQGW